MAGNQNSPKMLQILLGWGKNQPAISNELGEGQSKAKPAAMWMHLNAVVS